MPLRILIVDDEPDVREVLREYLEASGHDATAMPSGREALDHIAAGAPPYDVAIVDWHMPGITGRDVIESLNACCPDTAVLVSTGELGDALRPGKGGVGWDDVVLKPFSLRRLLTKVEQLASSPRGPRRDPGDDAGSA